MLHNHTNTNNVNSQISTPGPFPQNDAANSHNSQAGGFSDDAPFDKTIVNNDNAPGQSANVNSAQRSQDIANSSNSQDGHRVLMSHHKGLRGRHIENRENQLGREVNEYKEYENEKDIVASDASPSATEEDESPATTASNADEHKAKPKNTGGDAHHIAEQPMITQHGGLTGNQPVGEINFQKL